MDDHNKWRSCLSRPRFITDQNSFNLEGRKITTEDVNTLAVTTLSVYTTLLTITHDVQLTMFQSFIFSSFNNALLGSKWRSPFRLITTQLLSKRKEGRFFWKEPSSLAFRLMFNGCSTRSEETHNYISSNNTLDSWFQSPGLEINARKLAKC
jgi:hypothetical protein